MSGRNMKAFLVVAAMVAVAGSAAGQEAMRAPAATQPSEGTLTATLRFETVEYDDDRFGSPSDSIVRTTLRYGLTSDWSLNGFFSYTDREINGGEDVSGLDDPRIEAKWRFWQDDEPGLNTKRAALRFGTEVPIGDDDLGSDSWDPFVGVVFTSIQGRLGWNASAEYMLTTTGDGASVRAGQNSADLITLAGGVAYRVWPENFGGGAHGAGYVVLEGQGFFETNGDRELIVAPGLLWEDRKWAGEISLAVPVESELDDRAEKDWGLILGFRWLF